MDESLVLIINDLTKENKNLNELIEVLKTEIRELRAHVQTVEEKVWIQV